MSSTGFFVAGFATATIGTFIFIKVMKPQIVTIAAKSTSDSLVRFAQARGIPLQQFGLESQVIANQLIAPAISNAMSEVWL